MTRAVALAAGTEPTKSYEPTPEERGTLQTFLARKKQRPPGPRIKITEKGGEILASADHPMPSLGCSLIMQALGTTDFDFFDGLMAQLVNASMPGQKPDNRGLNFMLAAIKAIQPKDEAEAMLAAQMAAVHMATMTSRRECAIGPTSMGCTRWRRWPSGGRFRLCCGACGRPIDRLARRSRR